MFKKNKYKIISRVLVLFMLMMNFLSYLPQEVNSLSIEAEALEIDNVEKNMENTLSYFENNANELDSWETICAIVGAGGDIQDTSKWTLPDWDSNTIKTTDAASTYGSKILALIAMDKNPENIWGRNLIEELISKQDKTTGSFGSIFDHVYAMHALNISGVNYSEDLALDWLLKQENEEGGYGFSQDSRELDTTGMVLRIFGNYKDEPEVESKIEKSISYIKDEQLDSGGFASYGTENSNTIAVLISGLVSVGEDVLSEDWTKNDNNILDSLNQFKLSDDSYKWNLTGTETNMMSTIQSLEALGDIINDNSILNILDYKADTISVGLRIEGIKGNILNDTIKYKMLNDNSPTVAEVLSYALDKKDIDYSISDGEYGLFLNSIDDEESASFSGFDGWLYLINGESGNGIGLDTVVEGDDLLFYYGNFAPGTLIPEIKISPEKIYEDDEIIFEVTSTYYDWETDSTATVAIEDAKINIDDSAIILETDENGIAKVTPGSISHGEHSYKVSKQVEGEAPKIVRTESENFEVLPIEGITANLRIEGISETIFNEEVSFKGRENPVIADFLSYTLDKEEIDYEIADGDYGLFLNSIDGEELATFGGFDGWLYLINGESGNGIGLDTVEEGDKLVFYYGNFAPGTLIPEIKISPEKIYTDDEISFEVTSTYDDWSTGAPITTTTAVEGAKIDIDDGTLMVETNENGIAKVTPGSISHGDHSYKVSKEREEDVPAILRTDWMNFQIYKHSGGSGGLSGSKYRVNIAVLDDEGELIYGPKRVYISEDDEYEGSAIDGLNATGLDWSFSDDFYGMVSEIEGLENSGMDGWMYSVNEDTPKVLPIDKNVKSGDKILFWYSTLAMEGSPEWPETERTSSTGKVEKSEEEKHKETLAEYIDNFKDGKVLNSKDNMAKKDAERLSEILEKNKVSLSERYQGRELLISDDEVSILIPEDALDERLSIISKELEEKEIPKQYGVRLASSVYEFGPKGTKFDKAVTVSIKMPIYEEMDLQKFKPAWFNEETNKWVPLAYMLDAKNGMIVFQVDHFSKFTVIETENRVEFDDVREDIDWAKDAVEILAGQGIINGTEKGFEPNRYITRAEFIKLIVEAYEYEKSKATGNIFKDVAEDDWFSEYVETGFENKIIKGNKDGNFRPQDEISRNEIAVILSRLSDMEEINDFDLNFKDVQDIPQWSLSGVNFVVKENIMKGYEDNEFKGERPTTRAEAAVVLYRHLNFSINQ